MWLRLHVIAQFLFSFWNSYLLLLWLTLWLAKEPRHTLEAGIRNATEWQLDKSTFSLNAFFRPRCKCCNSLLHSNVNNYATDAMAEMQPVYSSATYTFNSASSSSLSSSLFLVAPASAKHHLTFKRLHVRLNPTIDMDRDKRDARSEKRQRTLKRTTYSVSS